MKKITVGFVIQNYDEDGKCTGQEFVAGDECYWEDDLGDFCDEPDEETYQSFDMIQPNSYEDILQDKKIFVIGHHHKHGVSTHIVSSVEEPEEKWIIKNVLEEFEPEKEEYFDVLLISPDDIIVKKD